MLCIIVDEVLSVVVVVVVIINAPLCVSNFLDIYHGEKT
jgi:hypothetical protein